MIRDVYFWRAPDGNGGMVMVFGEDGCQLPQYQGRIERVRSQVLEAAGEGSQFWIGQWNTGCGGPLTRSQWEEQTHFMEGETLAET